MSASGDKTSADRSNAARRLLILNLIRVADMPRPFDRGKCEISLLSKAPFRSVL